MICLFCFIMVLVFVPAIVSGFSRPDLQSTGWGSATQHTPVAGPCHRGVSPTVIPRASGPEFAVKKYHATILVVEDDPNDQVLIYAGSQFLPRKTKHHGGAAKPIGGDSRLLDDLPGSRGGRYREAVARGQPGQAR